MKCFAATDKFEQHNALSRMPKVAIVDYGMGNIFSIQNACKKVGLNAVATNSKQDLVLSDAVILPGVGAFGDAMKMLDKLNLIEFLQDISLLPKPFIGICLGMQLLTEESYEFGRHKGLGIIKGRTVRFNDVVDAQGQRLKVPHVGWNRIYKIKRNSERDLWNSSFLNGCYDGDFMYFVHSYYTEIQDSNIVLSKTQYGNLTFCSSLQMGNIFACQFHPERSGEKGMQIYKTLFSMIGESRRSK